MAAWRPRFTAKPTAQPLETPCLERAATGRPTRGPAKRGGEGTRETPPADYPLLMCNRLGDTVTAPNMECKAPYRKHGAEHRCGKCVACRIHRRDTWKARCILESLSAIDSAFLTLTYSEEHLPKTLDGRPTLRPEHMTDWLKRVRRGGEQFRYFLAGEYGERLGRPHYHALIFSQRFTDWREFHEEWKYGQTHQGTFTPQSAGYVVAYALKALGGQARQGDGSSEPVKEYGRMSLRPGIGALGVDHLPDLSNVGIRAFVERTRDVPGVLRLGDSLYPLGEYLRARWRRRLGLPDQDPARKQLGGLEAYLRKCVYTPEEWENNRNVSYQKAERYKQARKTFNTL